MSEQPTMEELASIALDHEKDGEAAKLLLVPEGSYFTKTPAKVYFSTGKEDGRVFGRVRAGLVNVETGAEDSISFSFSPESKIDERTGKPDSAFKRYLQLKKAYKAAFGADPATLADFGAYLEAYPVKLRIGIFGDGNAIYAITALA